MILGLAGGRLRPALHFIVLGTIAFMLIGKGDAREAVQISSQDLIAMKEDWEQANRTEAGPQVLKYFVNRLTYNEILIREALKLHFHQTDNVVWSRLIRNMAFASPDTSLSTSRETIQKTLQEGEELFGQALSLDMHLSDLIVRRRLIARMEQHIKNNYYIKQPDDSEIDRFIDNHPELFSNEMKISFCHVFLSPGNEVEEKEPSAKRLLRELRKETLPPEKAYKLGSMFPHPYCFRDVSISYLNNLLGKEFTDAILNCETLIWSGPLSSGYGTHLVRLESKKVTTLLDVPENRNRARNHLIVEKEKQLIQDMVTELSGKYYKVFIDGVRAHKFKLERLLDSKQMLNP